MIFKISSLTMSCFVSILIHVLLFSVSVFLLEESGFTTFDKNEVVVFDVDAGVDDAIAIMIALKAQALKIGPPVIGITCVHGNTQLKNVVVNVQRILELTNRQDIPIYIGSNNSLVFSMDSGSAYGEDGFGEIPYNPEGLVAPKDKHAVDALIEFANNFSGRLIIAAIGPLTNIALAERMYPGFLSKVKSILIMGGSCSGVGNIRPGVEFNTYMDVEAYHVVLSETNYKNAMILPWDPVVAGGIPQDWWINEFPAINNTWVSFIKDIGEIYLKKHPILYHADAVLYSAYLFPRIRTKSNPLKVQTITDGFGRGAFLIDYYHADREIEKK